jgi:3-phytase
MRPLLLLSFVLSVPALGQVVNATATLETDPALTGGDAVDDPSVWVHPSDVSKSLIIGTDKISGLFTYGLDGKTVQRVQDGTMGNADVRYDFPLGGKKVALIVANNRTTNGLSVYAVDAATRMLTNVGDGALATGIVGYGSCMYRSAKTGKYFEFVNDKNGITQQWELTDNGAAKVKATMVRQFDVGTQVEGCVADDQLGHFYTGEETVGVWKYDAEPGGGSARTQVDSTGGTGHLTADVEGLAIYYGPNGTGYLLASSQGNDTFAIYRREGANAYVGTFAVVDAAIDGVNGCDGIEVLNLGMGTAFPQGMFLAQDGVNPGANQNFKITPWERIANAFTPKLVIDTTSYDPRGTGTTTTTDAGTTTPDAGTTTTADAGTTTTPDAGEAEEIIPGRVDAGATPSEVDAGAAKPSAAQPVNNTEANVGCGCGAAPAGVLLLFLLVPIAARRRRPKVR